MPGSNSCRLCRNTCNDSIRLHDTNGRSNEVFSITIKFFHPSFLDVDQGAVNLLAVLCMECWHHISSFNNFQQTILLQQANLLKNVVLPLEDENQAQKMKSNNIRDPSDAIVIADDSADEEYISKTENTIDRDKVTEDPSSSGFGSGKIIVTDNAIQFEANVEHRTDHFEMPQAADITSGVDEKPIDIDEDSGDVVIIDEIQNELEDWDSGSNDSSDKSEVNLLMKMPDSTAGNSDTTIHQQKATKARHNPSAKEVDDFISKWIPNIECYVCSETRTTYTLLKKHFVKTHRNKEFYISCCSRKLKARCRTYEHAMFHLDPQAFKCTFCEKCFTARNSLNTHLMQAHPTGNGDGESGETLLPRYGCDICGKRYRVPSVLREHYVTHTGEILFHCQYCNAGFRHRSSKNQHMRNMHPDKLGKPIKTQDLSVCEVCQKTFRYRTGLLQHLRIYHPEEFAKTYKGRRKH